MRHHMIYIIGSDKVLCGQVWSSVILNMHIVRR